MVTTEVVPICGENAGAVGGALVNTVLRRLFHEAAQCLKTGLTFKSGILAKTVSDVRAVVIVNAASRLLSIVFVLLSVDTICSWSNTSGTKLGDSGCHSIRSTYGACTERG